MKKIILWAGLGCAIIAAVITAWALWNRHVQAQAYEARRAKIAREQFGAPIASYDEVYVAAHDGDLPRLKQLLDRHPDLLNGHFGGFNSTLLNTCRLQQENGRREGIAAPKCRCQRRHQRQ